MSDLCDTLERRLDGATRPSDRAPDRAAEADPGLGRELLDHLAGCPACRGRWEAHRLLAETLGGRPVPALPPGFEARVRRRIGAEEGSAAGAVRSGRGLRLLLPAYWTAAGVAGAAVLRWSGSADVPGAVTSAGTLGALALLATAAVTAAGLLVPAAALLRSRPDPLPRRLLAGPRR